MGDIIRRIFGKLKVEDAPNIRNAEKPLDESLHGEQEEASATSALKEAPLIKFARFVNGTLELLEARTDSIDYVAFSHCWGRWTWRSIPGIPYKVKASEEKADFIANDLPGLVGDGVFWMDTLTVDQTKEAEVLAIVDAIPTIFKQAKKTIAVRECDGLYDCCVKAVEGFEDYGDFAKRFYAHANKHDEYICAESYLQRVWTLQECLLSHTIEFVIGQNNHPKTKAVHQQYDDDHNFYRHQNDQTTLADSLWVLAYCVSGSEGIPGITRFIQAYVYGGTIVNSRSPLRTEEEDIHTGNFLRVNLGSHRSATMPRDYIFATMPAFPWYKYPKRKAIEMTFGEIYLDLYQQAAEAGHAFTCKFTRSMLEPGCSDQVDGWLPSQHLPRPTTLGDFLKLMGNRVSESSNATSNHVHVTSVVQIKDFVCHDSPNWVISALESSMALFQEQWQESHRGGELSKFGNFPSSHWTLDRLDAARWGWLSKDETWKLHILEDGDETVMSYGPGLAYDEDDTLQALYDLDETEAEAQVSEARDSVPLVIQARKILDHLWCAEDPKQVNISQQSDWSVFKKQMRAGWSTPLLRTMLLLAAMVNCRVPLSAAAWVNKLFVPVYIQHGDMLVTLGLLAKHARQPKSTRDQPLMMLSVGQHLPQAKTRATPFGKDVFIVDPKSRLPVGLIPDFMPLERTDSEYVKISSVLYNGFCRAVGKEVGIAICPLSALKDKNPSNDT